MEVHLSDQCSGVHLHPQRLALNTEPCLSREFLKSSNNNLVNSMLLQCKETKIAALISKSGNYLDLALAQHKRICSTGDQAGMTGGCRLWSWHWHSLMLHHTCKRESTTFSNRCLSQSTGMTLRLSHHFTKIHLHLRSFANLINIESSNILYMFQVTDHFQKMKHHR